MRDGPDQDKKVVVLVTVPFSFRLRFPSYGSAASEWCRSMLLWEVWMNDRVLLLVAGVMPSFCPSKSGLGGNRLVDDSRPPSGFVVGILTAIFLPA